MKILHVNTHERAGGAAIAANRLHKGLQAVGINSQLFVALNETDDTSVHRAYGKVAKVLRPFRQFPDYILPRLYRSRGSALFSPQLSPSLIHNAINSLQPDVIHVHWIADSFLPIFSLSKLKAPVVWTLHDTWAFTGGCHILRGCTNYLTGCGACPQLGSSIQHDLSWLSWKAKVQAYGKIKPTIVVPSQRFLNLVPKSPLLSEYATHHIPNGIDVENFKPVDRQIARELLNLPQGTKLIAFGAMSASSDYNKGFDLLRDALQELKAKSSEKIHCVIFGASHGDELPLPTHYLGTLHDATTLNLVYNAADVFVCPSREESFSQTCLEALSCGVPVVAFPVGAIPEMVTHKQSGYLAEPYDATDLAKGILCLLKNDSLRQTMSVNARKTVEGCYRIDLVTEKYKELYESILRTK